MVSRATDMVTEIDGNAEKCEWESRCESISAIRRWRQGAPDPYTSLE